MRRKILAILFVLLTAATTAFSQDAQPMIGEAAPDFTLQDLDGNAVSLSALLGSFVVIHFAASW